MAKFAAGIAAAVVVAKKLIDAGAEMVKAYGEQEQAEARLASAIRATGHEADINQQSLLKLASSLQKVTTFGDEATISAMAMLQQLANLDQQGLEKVTPAMLDFAAAMGVDLQTAASLIGKTLGSSTNALSRYGIEIDATASPTEKLVQLTEALNEKFAGTAETIANTTLGQIEQMKNAWGDLQEQGGKLITRVMLPLVEATADYVTHLNEVIEKRNALAGKSGEGEFLQAQADEAFRAYSKAYAEMSKIQDAVDKMNRPQAESWLGQAKVEQLKAAKETLAELTEEWYAAEDAVTEFNNKAAEAQKTIAGTIPIQEDLANVIEDTEENYGTLANISSGFMGLLPEFNMDMSISNKMFEANAAYIDDATQSMNAYYNTLEDVNEQLVQYAEDVAVARIESGEMEAHMERMEDLAETMTDAFSDLAANGLRAVGEALVDQEKGMESFKDAFKGAISTMLEALGKYLTTMAFSTFIANPALGVAYGAAAAAAYVASGAVQALADGGIVTKPTLALVGEAGPEAVVPLGKGGGMGGNAMVVNVYGNLLTERQLVDGILKRAASHMRRY